MVSQNDNKDWQRYALFGLLILTAIILFYKLGSFPLQMQWEPNYGQVVREMVWGEGDLITPSSKVGADEGAERGAFWSKPIMIFWLAYPFYKILGDTEWAARLPIALVGFFGIFMTYWFMSRLYTRRVGLLAGLMLITSPTYFLISRAFMVDVPFVVFMWVAFGFLLLGEREGKDRFYYLFYVFMGLSSLTKGLTPLILVGGTIFFYCIVSMDWAILKRMKMIKGSIIYLAIAAPWYTYMTSKYGTPYLQKFFWDHHFERAMGKLDKPNDTFEMFVLYFSIGVLPWITFLPQAIINIVPWSKKKADKSKIELLFFMGFLMCFGFFSVISTKFPHYIFPAVPFMAMLIAIYIDSLFDSDNKGEVNRITFFLALLVLIIVAPDLLDSKNYRTLFYFITTERLQNWHPSVADPTQVFTVIFALWGAILALSMVLRRFNRYIFAGFIALSVVYASYISTQMIPNLTEMFAARSIVHKYLDVRTSADEPIAEFTQTWKSRSIKYYIPFDELKNKYKYRKHRIQNNVGAVKRFYNLYKGKRVFIIIEQKQKHFNRINALWQEVSGGEQLVKIFDDRVAGQPYKPEFWLISNRNDKGKSKRLSESQIKEQLKKSVSKEAMKPEILADISMDKQFKLLGWDKIPTKIKRGKELKVTLYFSVDTPPTRDLKIFIHAERDKLFRLRGDHVPVEGRYPTTRWKKGDYIKDSYKLDIPAHTKEGHLDVFVGMFSGNYRVKVGKNKYKASDNRVKLGQIQVVK